MLMPVLVWYGVGESVPNNSFSFMGEKLKSAWLIGTYTNDIEYRVRRLGYKLTHYYPDIHFEKRSGTPPPMIVFSEDRFADPEDIHRLREVYPKTIMISIPVYFPSEDPSCHKPLKASSYGSLLRLITNIQERETRWEN